MKHYLYTLLIAALIIMTACNPVSPSKADKGTGDGSEEDGQSLSSSLGQDTSETGGDDVEIPYPEVAWDSDSEGVIVSATVSGGLIPETVKLNYIPSAQIFGDGRILWTEFDQEGMRSVYEGTLSSAEMTSLLQGAVDQGFFGWQDMYMSPIPPSDLPTKCVTITLDSMSKEVCEYDKGAPQAFHDLFEEFATGASVSGKDYIPEAGYLVSYAVSVKPKPSDDTEANTWSSDTSGVSLAQAENGVWIEGQALDLAWNLVNSSPIAPFVRERNTIYQISLQINGLSKVAPPSP